MSTQKTVKFSWTDENKAVVAAAYAGALAESGKDVANSTEFLGTVAKDVGAVSAASVRSQLVAAGLYQKGEIKKVGGGVSVPRKAHFIRAIEKAAVSNGVELEKGTFDSLEHAKADTLKALVNMIPNAPEELAAQLDPSDDE